MHPRQVPSDHIKELAEWGQPFIYTISPHIQSQVSLCERSTGRWVAGARGSSVTAGAEAGVTEHEASMSMASKTWRGGQSLDPAGI